MKLAKIFMFITIISLKLIYSWVNIWGDHSKLVVELPISFSLASRPRPFRYSLHYSIGRRNPNSLCTRVTVEALMSASTIHIMVWWPTLQLSISIPGGNRTQVFRMRSEGVSYHLILSPYSNHNCLIRVVKAHHLLPSSWHWASVALNLA